MEISQNFVAFSEYMNFTFPTLVWYIILYFGAKIRNNVSKNEVGTSVLKIYPYLSRSNFGQKSILLLAVLDCNPQLWSYVLIQREHPFLIVWQNFFFWVVKNVKSFLEIPFKIHSSCVFLLNYLRGRSQTTLTRKSG